MKKIIEGFQPFGGKHCITNSLKQVFNFYGHTLSEEMIFGLGEGLDFTYINLVHSPMVSGRSKVLELENVLSKHLGIEIKSKKSKDNNKIFEATKSMIDNNHPVLDNVDMPYLPYLSMVVRGYFGGHAIVIFGYDEEHSCFYVSDRDNSDYPIKTPKGIISKNYHLVSYAQMEMARASSFRPFPANNKYLIFDFTNFRGINNFSLLNAIIAVCNKMLSPEAKLKGIYGIEKFSKEIVKWASFDSAKLKIAGTTNYFQINADGGTGGGIFRKMYGGFLIEAAGLLKNSDIRVIGLQFIAISDKWDNVASDMWKLSQSGQKKLLNQMSKEIAELHDAEYALLSKLAKICNVCLQEL